MDIDDIICDFDNITILENENNNLISYIKSLDIDIIIKNNLLHLIYNNNYTNFIDIYNICIENDIDLPVEI